MVRIQFRQNPRSDEAVLTAVGHSDFSEKGSDIVCSAVSILIYTFADAAERAAGCRVEVEDLKEYKVYITSCSSQDRLKTVSETIIIGLSSLAEQYPEHVHLTLV